MRLPNSRGIPKMNQTKNKKEDLPIKPYKGSFSKPTGATREIIIQARAALPSEEQYNVNSILRKSIEIADKRYVGKSFKNQLGRMHIKSTNDLKQKIEYFLVYEDNAKK